VRGPHSVSQVETRSYSISAHEKLELLQKELQQSRDNSGVSGIAGTASYEPNPLNHKAQPVPDTSSLSNSHTEDGTTTGFLTEATGTVQLARIVWANRANQYRPQQVPCASSSSRASAALSSDRGSVRDQFVHDVVEVINDTRLYAEDTVPQQVIEWDCIKSSSTGKHFAVARNQSQAKKNLTILYGWYPGRSAGQHFQRSNDSSTDRRVLPQECRQGWVKISSRKAGLLQPISCNLEITESAGVSICVDAVATPRCVIPRSMEDSEKTSAPSTSFDRRPNGNGNLARPRILFKYLFAPDARPIPSVPHPRYEGPP